MAFVIDYITKGALCVLTLAILYAVYKLKKRNIRRYSSTNSRFYLQVLMAFLLVLLANSIYISTPNTQRLQMLPPFSRAIPPPEISLSYPSFARAGDTVEIVIEAAYSTVSTDIDISLHDRETAEILDKAFIILEPRTIVRHNFKNKMPNKNLDLEVVARHPDPVADISMELRTNIKIKRSGVETAALLLMGVLVALLTLDPITNLRPI